MSTVTAYAYHPLSGAYLGATAADESPLEPGVWLVPAYATLQAPPAIPPGHAARWDGSAWEVEALPPPAGATLEEQRATQDLALARDCAAAITAGVTCEALGAPHYYPTSVTDQLNLVGAVTVSLLPGTPVDWTQALTCRDASGEWARRLHTAEQLRAVGLAVVAHVDACRAQLASLRDALAAATTSGEVAAVTWTAP